MTNDELIAENSVMYNIFMKTILCDVGGVLLHVDFDRAFVRLEKESGIPEQKLRERVFSTDIKDKHDMGAISSSEFYRHIIPGNEIPFERFQEIWADIFTENSDMVECIRSCAGSFRLYIASNTDAVHYDYFCNKYTWFSVFDGFGLSFRLNRLKPSPEFYSELCREFDIDLRDAVFVDDLSENVDAANRLGIKAHLFVNTTVFRRFLNDLED
jgi:putative hydrolase of the HAD superfamily